MYKAVFLDLDGTLLDEEKNISIENKNAIKYAQSKGAYVCICSGRQCDIVKNFKEMAGANRYFIFSNGAGIYDCEENRVLFTSIIPREAGQRLHEIAIEKDAYIRVDTAYSRYINNEKYKMNTEIIFNKDEYYDFYEKNDVIQISIGSECKEYIDEISLHIKEKMSHMVKVENSYSFLSKESTIF